ncbi:unnamed protein product [Protopolystoma xenopodis]|uniref:Uncharacterized protein n=1 Tax=Protopolystoma xenopodis TaxID=117903 RepID=A0A3S5CR34_9PLAT|nr:unnamed protein product [Protopolystoma xenopodis]
MHQAAKEAQTKVNQSQDDLAAWKFSPESAKGKRLMSRMRRLLSDNEELGRVNLATRVSFLESESEIQATCVREYIKTYQGIEGVLEEAYTDLEGLQSCLFALKKQKDYMDKLITRLEFEIDSRQPGHSAELIAASLHALQPVSGSIDDPEDTRGEINQDIPKVLIGQEEPDDQ